MARDRDDDYEDEDDDRPRRRRRDDDDDRGRNLGPLDKMFRDTNIVVLLIFGFCCAVIALPLGLVGVLTAKDPKAKSNATIVTILSGVLWALSLVANVLKVVGGGANIPQ